MICLIENSQARSTQALMDQCHWFIVVLIETLALLCCLTCFCVSYVSQSKVTVYVT